jgi:hypothetical protein
VAVLPDNPGIYPALRLRNPFPVDWMLPGEYAGAEEQILEATRRLDREGDYLVLFQPFNAFSLPTATLQPATPKTGQFFWFSRLLWQMLPLLRGTPITCGPFRGTYAAPTP